VARSCDLDYVDPRSLRRDDTRALCLWAWTYNLSDIPKVTWLTITGNAVTAHDGLVRPRGRRGLTFRVLVHLDLIEFPEDDYGRTRTRGLKWQYGVIDGERGPRERHASPPPEDRPERRRGEDKDDRHGRRDDSSRIEAPSCFAATPVRRPGTWNGSAQNPDTDDAGMPPPRREVIDDIRCMPRRVVLALRRVRSAVALAPPHHQSLHAWTCSTATAGAEGVGGVLHRVLSRRSHH
jgi:hypothetical protein